MHDASLYKDIIKSYYNEKQESQSYRDKNFNFFKQSVMFLFKKLKFSPQRNQSFQYV